MKIIVLTETEYNILLEQDPSTKSEGGFQNLLVTLQQLTDEATRTISLPPIIVTRIHNYAFNYANGGWQNRLKSIFERTLGPNLDGNA